ncbi:MAG TPA: LysR family transcriptional regulator [Myxococcaceae bacterium]|nr:LysR family transcriptional regulator [Myxococcaceae bacterium]
MDRLDAMAAFVAVAELKGFAAAARKLKRSPPSVTRLVAGLEAHLSARLLHRTTRTVALTEAGARYLDRARRILGEVGDAEANARAEVAAPSGRLVVAAPLVFGRREVTPLMCEYLSRYPAVTAELVLADRLVSLVEEGVDVAVRIGVLEDSSLRVRPVGAVRRVLVASPAYLQARPAIRRPADLKAHAAIQVSGITPLPEWKLSREKVPLRPSLVTNSADAGIAAAEKGLGIVQVLSYQVADRVRAGALRVLLPRHEPPPIPIQLVHAAHRFPAASVRAFIDLAAQTRKWSFVDL